MAIADNRKRFMPLPEDRLPNRGQPLAYPEAVLLTNPVEPELKGEVSSPSSFYFSCLCTICCTTHKLIHCKFIPFVLFEGR